MDGPGRRDKLRSFALGGIVGASAVIAAARRRRRAASPRRSTPAGLAAFEEAPCYRELVDREERGGV
jgi:hypothetical protein